MTRNIKFIIIVLLLLTSLCITAQAEENTDESLTLLLLQKKAMLIQAQEQEQKRQQELRYTRFPVPDSFNEHETIIYNKCIEIGITDNAHIATILANVKHETANYNHFVELPSKYASSRKFYKGRGYIQLTHYDNYKNWSEWLNVDLLKNPDILVHDKQISSHIACSGMYHGSFTGKGTLSDYINDKRVNYYDARRLVNGDKDKQAGCDAQKCWTIGTKISDESMRYYNLITQQQ